MSRLSKEKLKALYDRLIPPWARLPLWMMLFVNVAGYELFKMCTFGREPFDVSLPIDSLVPMIPVTVLIYFASFPFWFFGYIVACRIDKPSLYRYFTADVTAKLFCFAIFVIMPTTRVRPEITGTGFSAWLMRLLYTIDTPLGLFPSLHCLNSWLCFIGVRAQKSVPLWYKIFSCALALAIFVSTMTTAQHLFVDVVAGFLIAEGFWQLSRISALQKLTERFLNAAERVKNGFFGLFGKKKKETDVLPEREEQ